nr:transposase, MuDR, MULE transposase domain protein [Tanacetum cinerariifolium]
MWLQSPSCGSDVKARNKESMCVDSFVKTSCATDINAYNVYNDSMDFDHDPNVVEQNEFDQNVADKNLIHDFDQTVEWKILLNGEVLEELQLSCPNFIVEEHQQVQRKAKASKYHVSPYMIQPESTQQNHKVRAQNKKVKKRGLPLTARDGKVIPDWKEAKKGMGGCLIRPEEADWAICDPFFNTFMLGDKTLCCYVDGVTYGVPWFSESIKNVYFLINAEDNHWIVAEFYIRSGVITFYDSLPLENLIVEDQKWWLYARQVYADKLPKLLIQSELMEKKNINPSNYSISYRTVTHIETDDEDCFKMVFIALGVVIRSFKYHKRSLIIIDASHFKGRYEGINLLAVGMDGNNQIIPITTSVSQGETGPSWTWFLSKLKECIGEIPNLTIISDRHATILSSCEAVFLNAFHGYCCRHLMMNYKLKSIKMQCLFWKMCKAYTVKDFGMGINKLRSKRPDVYEKLIEAGVERWSRAYYPRDRYNYMTSNLAESINSLTRDVRKVSITNLMEWYRKLVQGWYCERHEKYKDGPLDELSDWAKAKIRKRMQKSLNWVVVGRVYKVDDRRRIQTVELCNGTYQDLVYHVGEVSSWQIPNYLPIVKPSHMDKQPSGRPKNAKRIRSQGGGPVTIICGRCRARGHNRQGCRETISYTKDFLVDTNGLRCDIQAIVSLQTTWTIDEAIHIALKAEQTIKKNGIGSSMYKTKTNTNQSSSSQSGGDSQVDHSKSTHEVDGEKKKTTTTTTSTRAINKSSNNPYARPVGIKCYRCQKVGHTLNQCQATKRVYLAEGDKVHSESEDEGLIISPNTILEDDDDHSKAFLSNIDEKLTLVDDKGKPIEKIDYLGDHDSEDEVEPVEKEMASFLASNPSGVGYDTNSLLEKWRDTYRNADYNYNPYDVICMKGKKFMTIFNLYAISWISRK